MISRAKKKRKHHDLIVAWAKGADIEYRLGCYWFPVEFPTFDPEVEFRIRKD